MGIERRKSTEDGLGRAGARDTDARRGGRGGLDLFPLPAAELDGEGRIRRTNRAFADLTGFEPVDLEGRPFDTLTPGSSALGRAARRAAFSGASGGAGAEAEITTKAGAPLPVNITAKKTGEGGLVLAITDMSETEGLRRELSIAREELRERVEYLENFRSGILQTLRDLDRSEQDLENTCGQLRETQAQLVQSSKLTALGELAAGLAHELNQPLTVIKGLAKNMLRNHPEGGDLGERLRLMVDASGKMEVIIKHLRVFARSEAPEHRPVDLNRVVRDAFIMINELMKKSAVRVILELDNVPPVMGSANRLEQVIINLATNARDAMPGGGELRIRTEKERTRGGTFVTLTVSDTGGGMPPEVRSRAFDPFFTTKEKGKGTGLGLSISYGIVREHGGDISVDCPPRGGTVFTITLPAAGSEKTGKG